MHRVVFIFLYFVTVTVSAQILEKPKYSFEHFSWGMTVQQMYAITKGKEIQKAVSDDRNPFAKNLKDVLTFIYMEKVGTEKIGVGMQFQVKDSTLIGLSVMYIGMDSVTHEYFSDAEVRQEKLLRELTGHLPETPEERSIPFMGKVFTWKLPHLTVMAMNTSKSLVIIYKRPQ